MKRRRRQVISPIVILVLIAVVYYLLSSPGGKQLPLTATPAGNQNTPLANVTAPSSAHVWGKRTKTSGCQPTGPGGALPDPACTPGDVMETDPSKICKSGYAGTVRNVPDSRKNQDYAAYGITSHAPGQYEVDHLVSLELGGSNDISNLWPEPASPKPGFHEKDKVENYLHDQVCAGKMSLADAQLKIATNWLAVYNEIQK